MRTAALALPTLAVADELNPAKFISHHINPSHKHKHDLETFQAQGEMFQVGDADITSRSFMVRGDEKLTSKRRKGLDAVEGRLLEVLQQPGHDAVYEHSW